MNFDEKSFKVIYMLYRDKGEAEIKQEMDLTDEEYTEIMMKWNLDEKTHADFAEQSKGIGTKFMNLTRYPFMSQSDQEKGVPCPPAFKKQEGITFILPSPNEINKPVSPLAEMMEQRRSVRIYDEKPFTVDELSYLLWATQGVHLYKQTPKAAFTIRTVPSAGARHALETYLMINRVEGIPSGLYFYDAEYHQLLQLDTGKDVLENISQACFDQPMIKTAAITFIWVAVPYRMSWRYNERTWRYLHLDAGHVCQDLYLAGESIQAGTCAIGAYSDELFSIALDLDIAEEFVIYAATIGKKK